MRNRTGIKTTGIGLRTFLRLCSCVLAMVIAPVAVLAQEGRPQTHSFRLQHKPHGFALEVGVETEGREVQFKKEPEYGGSDVVRGGFPVGDDFVGFAYDQAGDKLYVDLNRNLDLTDDEGGVFEDETRFVSEFESVLIPGPTASAPYRVDVRFYGSYCVVDVKSGWEAEVELDGQKRRLAVIDNLDGVIGGNDVLVISEDANSKGGYAHDPHPNRIQAPTRLWFDGAHYELSFVFEEEELVATFTQTDVEVGRFELEGRQVSRLVLETNTVLDTDEPLSDGASPGMVTLTALVDKPEGHVTVPVGGYRVSDVYLEGGNPPGLFHARLDQHLTVAPGEPARLKAGGPLENKLAMTRSGRTFTFDYSLEGADGREYKELGDERGVLPEVLIARNGEQIAAGQFEYG